MSPESPLLERFLLLMGIGGIVLTGLASLLLVLPPTVAGSAGASIVGAFLVGVVGLTAGTGLIALSRILTYLRLMAMAPGREGVFE